MIDFETIRNFLSHFGLWIGLASIVFFMLSERAKRISDKKDLENLRENHRNEILNLRTELKDVRDTNKEILRELLKKN